MRAVEGGRTDGVEEEEEVSHAPAVFLAGEKEGVLRVMWSFGQGNERVDPLGERVDPLGERVDPLGERVDPLGERVDPLGERVDPLGERVDCPGSNTLPTTVPFPSLLSCSPDLGGLILLTLPWRPLGSNAMAT